MNKKTRDRLFGLFVVLFFIITSLLSLFATGYRFNLSWPPHFNQILEKTGTLALNSNPEKAIVTINSKERNSFFQKILGINRERTTPTKIKNLAPGDYVISFKLDGYWPYEKNITIFPQQTSFLENVILFKKSLPLNVINTASQPINYAPNGQYAYLEEDGSLVNLKTETKIANYGTSSIAWVDDGKQILKDHTLINLENNSQQDFTSIIGDCQKLKKQDYGDNLVCLNKDTLSTYNIKNKSSFLISSNAEILDFLIKDTSLVVVVKNNGHTGVKIFNVSTGKLEKESEAILNAQSFVITSHDPNRFIILDKDHQIIYLLDLNNKAIITDMISGVSAWQWINNNNFFYATGQEIYHYDPSSQKKELITRIGENINSLAWNEKNYLVYSTGRSIGIINLIDRQNDITSVWKNDNISSLLLDSKNEVVYFSGIIGQQSGLYKMYIR